MAGRSVDLEFPECCGNCPHRERFKGSCTHELRQSLASELDTDRTCPVYSREKTKAMRRLAADTT